MQHLIRMGTGPDHLVKHKEAEDSLENFPYVYLLSPQEMDWLLSLQRTVTSEMNKRWSSGESNWDLNLEAPTVSSSKKCYLGQLAFLGGLSGISSRSAMSTSPRIVHQKSILT